MSRFLFQATIFGFRLAPVLLVVYWILLFTGTHLPGSAMGSFKVSDKLLHFSAFAGLAFLLAWALPRKVGGRIPGVAVAGILSVIYAAIDEWTQGFVPRRTPDISDFFADVLGMIVGLAVYFILRSLLQRWSRSLPPRPEAATCR
ncbi:VanZ family protein [Planctomycetaceae bacterium SH139]